MLHICKRKYASIWLSLITVTVHVCCNCFLILLLEYHGLSGIFLWPFHITISCGSSETRMITELWIKYTWQCDGHDWIKTWYFTLWKKYSLSTTILYSYKCCTKLSLTFISKIKLQKRLLQICNYYHFICTQSINATMICSIPFYCLYRNTNVFSITIWKNITNTNTLYPKKL